MKRLSCSGRAFLLGGSVAAAVLLYNSWLYCCGRCTLGTFFTLGPAGIFLLLLTIAAACAWRVLHCRRRRSPFSRRCSCGQDLTAGWHFCPACGAALSS